MAERAGSFDTGRVKRHPLTLYVFLAATVLTLLAWFQAREIAEARDRQRFEQVGNIVANEISDRIEAYVDLLEQSRSLFKLDFTLSPEEWRTYVNDLHVEKRFPGIQGLGFAKRISREQVGAEIARLRTYENYSEFAIWPTEPGRAEYYPTTLIEPKDWRNRRALGFDMYSESIRHTAMDAAISTGSAHLSDPVILVQETEVDPQVGFLIYTPVYISGFQLTTPEERRAAIFGLLYAPLRAKDLFNTIANDIQRFTDITYVDFEIFLTSPGVTADSSALLFDRDDQLRTGNENAEVIQTRAITIPVGGKQLTLHVYALRGFQSLTGLILSWSILAAGLALTILLTQLVWSRALQANESGKSERQLRLVTNTLPSLVGYVGPDEKLHFVNRAFDEWFANQGETALGRPIRELLSTANFKCIQNAMSEAIQGRSTHLECHLVMASGQDRSCVGHFIPDFGPQGRVKGVVMVISDVTETKRAEDQARLLLAATTVLHGSLEGEDMIARFTDALVPDFADWATVDLLDDSGRLHRIAGTHRDSNLTAFIQADLEHNPVHLDSDNLAGDMLRTREPQFVPEITDADLEKIPNPVRRDQLRVLGVGSLLMIPLTTRERTLGALFFGRIPQSKRFDDQDYDFAKDIGRRTTLALENLRLFKDVHAANRAKDEFLATVSHELRTPMNVILGWIEILKAEKPTHSEQDAILETVERNAKVQIQLINELLDISRIVSGKLSLHPRPLKLTQVMELAVESVRPAASAKKIELKLSASEGLPRISADADRLHQVLWNLLSNAIKFTPPGGTITVSVLPLEGGVSVQVRDTGRGIDPKFLPFVFERFRQEESGTNRFHGGLGLGLSIVRYLVELHGGTVGVESAGRDQGSTFSFFIPSSNTQSEPECPPLSSIETREPTAHPHKRTENKRPLADLDILLVDDSADVRALIARILSKAGATVASAASAHEALTILRKGVFDVLISDIGLPEIDGYEFIRLVRDLERKRGHNRMPAAALTAYASAKDAQRAREAGYDIHISKPAEGRQLIMDVADLAKGGQGPDPGVRSLHGA